MIKVKPISAKYVKEIVTLLRKDEKSIVTRKILNNLFQKYPLNNKIEIVYLKVIALNELYYTVIYDTFKVSKHILKLNLDKDLREGHISVVNKIAKGHGVKTKNNNSYNFYSFATKYCHYQFPDDYPIYDRNVAEALWAYKRKDNFSTFKKKELKDYVIFNQVLNDFCKFYKLTRLNRKEIDDFLWKTGEKLLDKNRL